MISVRAPGKLMLAGEYAVLAGAPAIVCAVNRYLVCEARPADHSSIEGVGRHWTEGSEEVPELKFACVALRAASDYLVGRGLPAAQLAVSLCDELKAPEGAKLGLGGSACTSVVVVAAALASRGVALDKGLVFKLAAIAHAKAQGRAGSSLDVAAATHGGTLFTRRFEAEPLRAAWKAGPVPFAASVDRAEVPELQRLRGPKALLLAFSGHSASTAPLVDEIERYASREPRGWAEFVARTSAGCDGLRRALEADDEAGISIALRIAGGQLDSLGARSGTPIAMDERIARVGQKLDVAIKVSGAGGGDSCVALGPPSALDALAKELKVDGIFACRLECDEAGVVVERA